MSADIHAYCDWCHRIASFGGWVVGREALYYFACGDHVGLVGGMGADRLPHISPEPRPRRKHKVAKEEK